MIRGTAGFVNPIGLAVSTDGTTLMVADSESGTNVCQQIKAFSTSNGSTAWTLGQLGGYATNGPAITNNKYMLEGMICPQSDGSSGLPIWPPAIAPCTSAPRVRLSRTSSIYRSYTAAIDQNNSTRVFQNFVEYQINYSDAFTENQGWTPVNNWSYLNGVDFDPSPTTVEMTA